MKYFEGLRNVVCCVIIVVKDQNFLLTIKVLDAREKIAELGACRTNDAGLAEDRVEG